ncbi:UNVERIFIED_CONTAM: hypothetical protein FKN15_034765 [Acipenser sinensis]
MEGLVGYLKAKLRAKYTILDLKRNFTGYSDTCMAAYYEFEKECYLTSGEYKAYVDSGRRLSANELTLCGREIEAALLNDAALDSVDVDVDVCYERIKKYLAVRRIVENERYKAYICAFKSLRLEEMVLCEMVKQFEDVTGDCEYSQELNGTERWVCGMDDEIKEGKVRPSVVVRYLQAKRSDWVKNHPDQFFDYCSPEAIVHILRSPHKDLKLAKHRFFLEMLLCEPVQVREDVSDESLECEAYITAKQALNLEEFLLCEEGKVLETSSVRPLEVATYLKTRRVYWEKLNPVTVADRIRPEEVVRCLWALYQYRYCWKMANNPVYKLTPVETRLCLLA